MVQTGLARTYMHNRGRSEPYRYLRFQHRSYDRDFTQQPEKYRHAVQGAAETNVKLHRQP
jgi:hypothetical protein